MSGDADMKFKTTMEFAYGVPKEMAPGVVRIVASNPSPFTFKGTNTYIVGSKELAVIDPGPGDPAHVAAILAAARGRPITHILVTHTHHDHVGDLAALVQATGARTAGYGRSISARGTRTSPSGGEFVDRDFKPDIALLHETHIAGNGWAFKALFTPGHAPDHLCFELEGTGLLFSGDHVMSWNTSVVAPPEGRMADYLASLELLIGRDDALFLPGHGGRLENPQRMVRAYLVHRRWREQAILDALRGGSDTIRKIVEVVYRGIDARLVTAASLSVQAHVEHLIERRLVLSELPLSFDRRLSAA
jgi:glyoxylase-like metal-dependent hydrolase (beta-lactamase superfamily II)